MSLSQGNKQTKTHQKQTHSEILLFSFYRLVKTIMKRTAVREKHIEEYIFIFPCRLEKLFPCF